MYPQKFDYFCPDTLEGVIELLTRYGEDAREQARARLVEFSEALPR